MFVVVAVVAEELEIKEMKVLLELVGLFH